MPESICYLGWDVGGWEGSSDGLAALQWTDRDGLQLVGTPVCIRLKPRIAKGDLSFPDLLDACGTPKSWDRIVLGIDAPLGWPAEFAELVCSGLTEPPIYLPREDGHINNRFAFRICDRLVHELCGKTPMSPAFNRLGNNVTKAITVSKLLANNDSAVVAFERTQTAPLVIIEVYPALWKRGGGKADALTHDAAEALDGCDLPRAIRANERDAILAALTAACYDAQTRRLNRDLPHLYMPEDYLAQDDAADLANVIAREGWIFFPREALRED